jgi:hypothetical protein
VRGVYFYKKQNRLLPLLIFFKDAIFFKKSSIQPHAAFILARLKCVAWQAELDDKAKQIAPPSSVTT